MQRLRHRRGVKKLRLTGGEPLVRKNVMSLFRGLGRHLESGALEELTLTTNGSQLAKYARELADIGVKRRQRVDGHAGFATSSASSPAGAKSRLR